MLLLRPLPLCLTHAVWLWEAAAVVAVEAADWVVGLPAGVHSALRGGAPLLWVMPWSNATCCAAL